MFEVSFFQLLRHFVSYPIRQKVFLTPYYNWQDKFVVRIYTSASSMLEMLIVPDTKCFSSKAKVLTTSRLPKTNWSFTFNVPLTQLDIFRDRFYQNHRIQFYLHYSAGATRWKIICGQHFQPYPRTFGVFPPVKKQSKSPCGCVTKKVCCTSLWVCTDSCYGQPQY